MLVYAFPLRWSHPGPLFLVMKYLFRGCLRATLRSVTVRWVATTINLIWSRPEGWQTKIILIWSRFVGNHEKHYFNIGLY